jgi:hypothetical protein
MSMTLAPRRKTRGWGHAKRWWCGLNRESCCLRGPRASKVREEAQELALRNRNLGRTRKGGQELDRSRR